MQLDHLKTHWNDLAKNAALLNINLLEDKINQLKDLQDFLDQLEKEAQPGQETLSDSIIKFYENTSREIEETHLKWCMFSIIREYQGKNERRGPMTFLPANVLTDGATEIWHKISNLCKNEEYDEAYKKFSEEIGGFSFYESSYLSACVAYQLGSWSEALDLSERALTIYKSTLSQNINDKDRDNVKSFEEIQRCFEIKFLLSMCQRFSLLEICKNENVHTDHLKNKLQKHYYKAKEDHYETIRWCLDYHDIFMDTRAKCELGSLYLFSAVIQKILDIEEVFDGHSSVTLANSAIGLLERAQIMADQKDLLRENEAMGGVRRQVNMNLITLAIFLVLNGIDEEDEEILVRPSVANAYACMNDLYESDDNTVNKLEHNRIELNIYKYLRDGKPKEDEKILDEAQSLLNKKETKGFTAFDEKWMQYYLFEIQGI